jgi:hypothetical protein
MKKNWVASSLKNLPILQKTEKKHVTVPSFIAIQGYLKMQ